MQKISQFLTQNLPWGLLVHQYYWETAYFVTKKWVLLVLLKKETFDIDGGGTLLGLCHKILRKVNIFRDMSELINMYMTPQRGSDCPGSEINRGLLMTMTT